MAAHKVSMPLECDLSDVQRTVLSGFRLHLTSIRSGTQIHGCQIKWQGMCPCGPIPKLMAVDTTTVQIPQRQGDFGRLLQLQREGGQCEAWIGIILPQMHHLGAPHFVITYT